MKYLFFLFAFLLVTALCIPAWAQQTDQQAAIEELKARLDALKTDYETKIREMQDQIEQLQLQMLQAPGPEEVITAPPQPAVQNIPGALNPAIGVIGNFLTRADDQEVLNEDGDRLDNKLSLREVEVDFRAAVDPFADAVLITAMEAEAPGVFEVDVEEGYVTIKKLPFLESPPAGLKLKTGRFRPSFGKFNILHLHDLPQSFRSLVTEEFLGPEGFIQSGLSANFFLPSPGESSLDATLELLTGGDVAISPDLNSRISYLGHLRWFNSFDPANSMELGWSSYYHPSGNDVSAVDFHGVDFQYRWKPLRQGQWKSFLLGGELMFARRAYPDASEPADVARAIEQDGLEPGEGKPWGVSLYSQWQFSRRIYAGARWDQTTTLFNPDFSRTSLTPYISYYFSEFLRFRLNYERRWSDFSTEDGRNAFFFELNWVFGAHPPEPFWVNK